MPTNLFDRHTGASINLDGREGDIDSPSAEGVIVTLLMQPKQIEPNTATGVTVQVIRNGSPWAGQVVNLSSSNPSVGPVPATVTTSTDGKSVFQVVGLTLGSTIITASSGGVSAEPATLTVAQQQAPENYDATGYGRVTLTIESPLANALTPRVQRLSFQEQQRRHRDDTGLRLLSFYESAQIVFVPKALQ